MTNAKSIILQVAAACLVLFSGAGAAATTPLNLSTVPLYLEASGVAPNIYLTLDDSGSMAWAYMPDSLYNDRTYHRFESSSFNPMYYDPTVTYQPPIGANGSSLGKVSFAKAWRDGYDHNAGTYNLNTQYRATLYYYDSGYYRRTGRRRPGPAYYYQHDSGSGCVNKITDSCYTLVDVTTKSAAQQQNFANWFSYYRTRILMAKTAISLAFGKLGSDVRVAGQNINTNKLRPNSPSGVQMLHPFSRNDRSKWFSWLDGVTPNGGTPLRLALKHVGKYYSTSGSKSPYAETPGIQDTPEYSCRQNFSVLMTDGMWNGNSPGVRNADGTNGPVITGADGKTYQYKPTSPYTDGWSNTLADVAMHYWDHDLRTNLANDVPTYLPDIHYQADGVTTDQTKTFYDYRNDPADWQHMVTFTIGLGVNGTLDPSDLPGLIAGTKSWPKPAYNTVTTIDDLWHAAIDGRGDYLSAKNPQSLVSAFANIIGAIGQRTSSFSAAALTSGSLQANTQLITATFDGSTWSGDVQATALDSSGNLGSIVWDANCILSGRTGSACVAEPGNTTTQSARTLLTYDAATGQGIPFQWADLSTSQQKDLNTNPDTGVIGSLGSQRLKYLRGYRSQEQVNGGPFRSRPGGVLGDIVHSAPVYVGPPSRFYYWGSGSPHSAWTASYAQFKKTYAARRPIVYVGANDGMLHGFRDDTGQEVLGFVPSAVFDALNQLTSPNYAHRYYVDSTPTENDVYFTGAAQWRSVLVGGLGGGGKGIYALDITDPAAFTEGNAKNLVLWEFTAAKAPPYGDPNLGDTYSRPAIVLLNNGVWAAVFGNGYNSSCAGSGCGDAMLYVVNIETGKLIKKIDTGIGPAQDPTGKNRPDGLATVEPVDADSNYTTDYVYAGDLYGNLWKFDLSSSNTSQWKVAYGQPLFKAVDAGGNPQPITTRPVVGVNPSGPGFMVYFGTGKYLEKSDAVPHTTTVQSVYGIWDKNGSTLTPITRNDLQAQTITDEVTQFGDQLRVVSSNRINWTQQDGWYLDLESSVSGAQGEMVVTDPILRSGKLIFTTLIPNANLCSSGGNSWLFEINASSGGRLPYSVFDLNGDNTFNSQDYVKVTNPNTGKDTYVPASGMKSKNGLLSQPAILSNCKGANCLYLQGSNGKKPSPLLSNGGPGTNGRQSWRQLQ
jgi:type IV pilus assembly protein PilY1